MTALHEIGCLVRRAYDAGSLVEGLQELRPHLLLLHEDPNGGGEAAAAAWFAVDLMRWSSPLRVLYYGEEWIESPARAARESLGLREHVLRIDDLGAKIRRCLPYIVRATESDARALQVLGEQADELTAPFLSELSIEKMKMVLEEFSLELAAKLTGGSPNRRAARLLRCTWSTYWSRCKMHGLVDQEIDEDDRSEPAGPTKVRSLGRSAARMSRRL